MNTEEIQEQLKDVQEAAVNLNERLIALENRKIKMPEISIPDYFPQFQEIKDLITAQTASLLPAETAERIILKMEKLTQQIPDLIKVRHEHHFDNKSKGFVIGASLLILAMIISIGLAFGLWKENKRLHDNSVKFRMIRQSFPNTARWADTAYYADPEKMEQKTEQREAEQQAISRAEAEAREKEKEAEKAREKAERLKKDKR